MLSQVEGIDLRLLHVVRDSRAVAHAWTKTVARPEADGVPMPVYGPAKAAVLWDVQNAVIEHMQRRHPYLQGAGTKTSLRHRRTSCSTPRASPASKEEPACWTSSTATPSVSGPSHTVAGNPMRFVSGDITIRSDQSWHSEMPAGRRRFVGALTMPLQRHYGYGSRTS